jgi:putative oxidoreductase
MGRWGVLPLRLVVGLVFVMHGGQKLLTTGLAGTAGFLGQVGVPLPWLAAPMVIALELLGGLAVLLGLRTRIVALLLALEMLAALVTVHLPHGFFLPRGFEFVLTLLASCLTLVALGPGPLSVDRS